MAKGISSAGGGSASCSTEQTGLNATPRGGFRVSATAVAAAKTVVKRDDALPFMSETYSPRGRLLAWSYFDVPNEGYAEGWVTGVRTASLLLRALEREPSSIRLKHILREAIKEASAICSESKIERRPDRRGAATAFLVIVQDIVAAGAGGTARYLASRLAEAQRSADIWRNLEEQGRSDFVNRMRAAKTAKAATEVANA